MTKPPPGPHLCPHCGNVALQETLFACTAPLRAYGPDGSPFDGETNVESEYYLLRCTTCRDVALYSGNDHFPWRMFDLEFPSRYQIDRSVPQVIAEIYGEAKRLQTISPNNFAVNIRKALEAVCDDRKVPPANLAKRLRALADAGEIPGALAKITTALRELGNSGAHSSGRQVTVPLTWAMDELFRALIEYVYVAPHRLAEYERRLAKDRWP